MILTILTFLLILSVVVVFHEFGHYIVAKSSGMKVFEFAIGFGPKMFSWKRNGTLFSVNWLPLGGFVNIAGLADDNVIKKKEKDSPQDELSSFLPHESFQAKSLARRMATVIAGPAMNMVLAILIYFLIFSILGIPTKLTNEIESILPNSQASSVGLQPGDKIISINQAPIEDMEKAIALIHKSRGETLTLRIERKEGEKTSFFSTRVVPQWNEAQQVSLIGFTPKYENERQNIFTAFQMSVLQTWDSVRLIFWTLGQLFTGKASVTDLAGPVGIAQITGQAVSQGLMSLMTLAAFLSINLGIINILPIPALDGGRLFFLVIEFVCRKPLDQRKETMIHYVGFALLLTLMFFLTINDIRRIIGI